MNSLFSSISAQDLRRAAKIREKIDTLQSELARILGSDAVTSSRESGLRRKVSATTRAKIAAGARARWAKVARAAGLSRKKRSPAVRARLAAIARERWKKAKAAGKSTL